MMAKRFSHLAGKRVLVTRAAGQAGRDLKALTEAGALPIHIPLIEICAPTDGFAALDRAIARLDSYDWIAFTSANAVAAFFDRCSQVRKAAALPKGINISAVGPATAAAIEERGARASLVPKRHDSAGLFEAMIEALKGGERILFPRALEGRDVLVDGLRAKGFDVEVAEAYRTISPPGLDSERLVSLIDGDGLDAALFASPSAVLNFAAAVGLERARRFSAAAEIITIGPATTQALEHVGMKAAAP